MQIDVVTIFPEVFAPVLGVSILKRAQERDLVRIATHNLRDFTHDKRRTVDDRPYGGGPGMVMKIEPICEAVEAVKRSCAHQGTSRRAAANPNGSMMPAQPTASARCQTILMSPQGERFSSCLARELALCEHLIILCGHYEGVDERVKLALVDRVISIGDYVLTGGELPALVLIDGLARFIPEVIGHARATEEESFAGGWLEYPQYTRPAIFRDMAVPHILRSGDHERIGHWRKLQSVARTLASRPDLDHETAQPSA